MKHPLSLTPSLSYALDDLMGESPEARGRNLPHLRFAADVLGLAIFFIMLGTYLTIRL